MDAAFRRPSTGTEQPRRLNRSVQKSPASFAGRAFCVTHELYGLLQNEPGDDGFSIEFNPVLAIKVGNRIARLDGARSCSSSRGASGNIGCQLGCGRTGSGVLRW